MYRLAYNGDVVAFKMGRRLVKRVGGSAFAKHHQLRRDLLIVVAVSKSGLTSPDADTPIRRPASPAGHGSTHALKKSSWGEVAPLRLEVSRCGASFCFCSLFFSILRRCVGFERTEKTS